MALVLADRVQETAAAPGTGSVSLLGAATGFQSFAVIGNGNVTFYCIADQAGSNWEVGIGTYSTTGPTLSRDTVLASSNSGSIVDFSTGTQNVFVTYPSEKSVNLDSSGNVSPLGTVASGTWQGTTVGVAYGGTGVTASSGANSVVLRDANVNASANNFFAGYNSITASGGTTTLTAASGYFQKVFGSTTQTIKLPDATTLPNGAAYLVDNDSSGDVYIQNASGTQIELVPPGGIHYFFVENNTTVSGLWGRYSWLPANVEWGTNSLFLDTTIITGGTWNGGTIGTAYGGTGLTTFGAANYALYSTSTSALTAGTLPVAAGGTGATTLTGYVKGTGTSALTASSTIPGSDVSGDISGDAANVTGTVLVTHGGTGLTSVPQYYVPFGDTSTALDTSVNFQYNGSTLRVGNEPLISGATNPVIGQTGSFNSYIQTYIYNANTGTSASADFTAYPDNGSDANGWVDVGITSSTYSDSAYSVTGPNEPYLFGSAPSGSSTSGNLVYATDSTGTTNYHQWYVGGFDQTKAEWRMQLTPTGLQLANVLATTYGGTGLTSFTSGGAVYATSTSALTTGTLPTSAGGTGNTTGQAASVANALTAGTAISFSSGTTYNGSAAITINNAGVTSFTSSSGLSTNTSATGAVSVTNTAPMVYPGAGIAVSTGSSWTTSLTAPSGAVVGTTDTQTLTNKRVTARIGTVTSAATITPTADSSDQYNVTALATTATFAAPSGTPTDGQKLTIRLEASTTQTISWTTTSGGYRPIGTTLPTSAPTGKTIYVGCIYNAQDTFWDVVAVATQA